MYCGNPRVASPLFVDTCFDGKCTLQVDNRMRAWYIKNMSVGLLYQCNLGDLRLDSPVALLQNRRQDGVDFMEVVPMEHQLPAQRDQVTPVLLRHAVPVTLCMLRL